MIRHMSKVKPSRKPVPPTVRYPRRVRTLLVSVWFSLRERASVKSGRRCVLTVMVVEPHMAARAGIVWPSNQVKPSQRSMPPTVLHWTGPGYVALVLSPGRAFRASRFDCWYGMCEAVAVISMVVVYAHLMGYRYAQESECCKGKQQTGLCGGKQL